MGRFGMILMNGLGAARDDIFGAQDDGTGMRPDDIGEMIFGQLWTMKEKLAMRKIGACNAGKAINCYPELVSGSHNRIFQQYLRRNIGCQLEFQLCHSVTKKTV